MANAAAAEWWTRQAFKFALDPTPEQKTLLLRHMGVRRKAYNWAVAQIKARIETYNETGQAGAAPSLGWLRKQWNVEKRELCVDPDTGHQWWTDLSKEAAANGIDDAVRAYWAWVKSRKGERRGTRLGFPKFKRKGRSRNSYRVTTGVFRLVDRRHVQLPGVGVVRL